MHLTNVDLPAPLSPTSAVTSPAFAVKSTEESTWTGPNDLSTPRSSSVGLAVMSYHLLCRARGGRRGRGDPPGLSRATDLDALAEHNCTSAAVGQTAAAVT
jgi:hypothetical protein